MEFHEPAESSRGKSVFITIAIVCAGLVLAGVGGVIRVVGVGLDLARACDPCEENYAKIAAGAQGIDIVVDPSLSVPVEPEYTTSHQQMDDREVHVGARYQGDVRRITIRRKHATNADVRLEFFFTDEGDGMTVHAEAWHRMDPLTNVVGEVTLDRDDVFASGTLSCSFWVQADRRTWNAIVPTCLYGSFQIEL